MPDRSDRLKRKRPLRIYVFDWWMMPVLLTHRIAAYLVEGWMWIGAKTLGLEGSLDLDISCSSWIPEERMANCDCPDCAAWRAENPELAKRYRYRCDDPTA